MNALSHAYLTELDEVLKIIIEENKHCSLLFNPNTTQAIFTLEP